MYRLAEIQDRTIQKLITKDLITAFDTAFWMDKKGHPDVEAVKDVFVSTQFDIEPEKPTDAKELQQKTNQLVRLIGGLYKELEDSDNEYTFSEFG